MTKEARISMKGIGSAYSRQRLMILYKNANFQLKITDTDIYCPFLTRKEAMINKILTKL